MQKPYAIVDLSTGLAFSKGFQVKLFARNLFDRKYAAAILPDLQSGSASAPAGYAQIIPMAARRLLGVELSGRF